MAAYEKRTLHTGDPQQGELRTPMFTFTPQEMDLVALALEEAMHQSGIFTPSEGIRLSRIKAMIDDAAEWADPDGGDDGA